MSSSSLSIIVDAAVSHSMAAAAPHRAPAAAVVAPDCPLQI
jgi:hypothetical protein